MSKIITISREFGSGGRELGRRLADYLGIAYYDKEILNEIEKKTPFSKDYIEQMTENRPVLLYPIHYGVTWNVGPNPNLKQSVDIYKTQADTIRDLASKGSCVIIGRCADYILKDLHPIRIFVYSDMDSKVERCKKREKDHENLSDKEIKKRIKTIDKNRRKYYEFYTDSKWGDRDNYDFLINTTNADIKDLAQTLADLIKKMI